jgi:ribose transport system substrate-binding protein
MRRTAVAVFAVLGLVLTVAACGSSSKGSSQSASNTVASGATSSPTTTAAALAGSCGSIPHQMPADPEGVLAKLPASLQSAYNLFPQAVHTSAWAHWKPQHAGPYTMYFSPGDTATPLIQEMSAQFSTLKAKSNLIGKIITQDSNNSVQTQIQQIQQAIREKVDIMVVLPLSPAADAPVLEQAGKSGIPVITPISPSSNPYVVGVFGNIPLWGAKLAQGLVSALGDKGSVLDVHGIPGVYSDSGIYQGASDVLKNCPNIKTVGSIVGEFTPSVAKTATLQYLTAHPQPVDGAIETGGMSTGIIQAFQQTGRTVPAIADEGATPGALAYWEAHRATYKAVALGTAPPKFADGIWDVAAGMLTGRGVAISDISVEPPIVTSANLSQWVQPGWSLTTPIAYAPGPVNLSLLSPSDLSHFFNKPASSAH